MSNQVGNQIGCFYTSWLKCFLYDCRLKMKALLAVPLTAVAATQRHQSSVHSHQSSAYRHQSSAHSLQPSAYRHQSSAARSFLLYVREKMANVGFEITEIRDKIEDCCNQAGQSVEQAPRYKNFYAQLS